MSNEKETTETLGESEELSTSEVAETVLKSESSWEILKQMSGMAVSQLMATQRFVLPVLSQLSVICEKLSDPEAFTRSFNTLTGDIQSHAKQLRSLAVEHEGKSGEPTEDEWPLIFSVSQEYSNLLTNFETVIQPLMLSLIDTVQKEYGDVVEMKTEG